MVLCICGILAIVNQSLKWFWNSLWIFDNVTTESRSPMKTKEEFNETCTKPYISDRKQMQNTIIQIIHDVNNVKVIQNSLNFLSVFSLYRKRNFFLLSIKQRRTHSNSNKCAYSVHKITQCVCILSEYYSNNFSVIRAFDFG